MENEKTKFTEDVEVIQFDHLDLGSGAYRKRGYVGVDNKEAFLYQGGKEEDWKYVIQWDLNLGIPFPDNSITDIYCSHFIEHVKSPIHFLYEMLRVCKNNSHVEIFVPLHELESVGHLTEFHKDWFEDAILKEFDGRFIILKKFTQKKTTPLRLENGGTVERSFDEMFVLLKILK